MLFRRDARAEPFADADPVALVEFAAHRVDRCGTRHEGLAILFVVSVASGREHDALSGADVNLAARGFDRRAGDAPVALIDGGDRRVEQNFDAAFAQTVEQPRRERVAHHQPRAARVAQPIGGVTRQQLGRVAEIGQRLEAADEGRDVGLADHHAAEQHVFGDRRAQPREVGAEQASVKRLRNDRPAADRGALHVAAIIRMPPARHELHIGIAFQIIDRGGPGFEKRRAQLAARGAADQRV
jgi:hypothetical protein